MKTITINVEFTVIVMDTVEPNDVTFDIPIDAIRVDETGREDVGRVTGYCTQEYVN